MKRIPTVLIGLGFAVLAGTLVGCASGMYGGVYDDGDDGPAYNYGMDYYEPGGFDYGWWDGGGYWGGAPVYGYHGPYRGPGPGFRPHGGPRPFRPGSPSHGMPSIPHGSRGGGMRGGGGGMHGGGMHGGGHH